MIDLGLEKLSTKLLSPAAKELIDVFRPICDAVYSIKDTKIMRLEIKKQQKIFNKQIVGVIKKHFGINIIRIDYSNNINLAIYMSTGKGLQYIDENGKPQPYPSWLPYAPMKYNLRVPDDMIDPKLLEDVPKLANQFYKTGKFSNVPNTNFKYVFDAVLGFNLQLILLMHRIVPGIEPVTPEELTGILIHEIGHCVMGIVYLGHKYMTRSALEGTFVNFIKDPKTPRSKKRDTVVKMINSLPDKVKDKLNQKQVAAIIKSQEITNDKIDEPSDANIALDILMVTLGYTVFGIYFGISIMADVAVTAITKAFVPTFNKGPKTNDIYTAYVNHLESEKYADVFAASHGVFATTALYKLTVMDEYYHKGTKRNHIRAYRNFITLLNYVKDVLHSTDDGPLKDVHGSTYRRNENMKKYIISCLKQTDFDADTKLALIAQYEALSNINNKTTYAVYEEERQVQMALLVHRAATRILTSFWKYDHASTSNDLQEAFDNLINNKLYVSAAKLDAMINKLT